jgi:hypothetical protein
MASTIDDVDLKTVESNDTEMPRRILRKGHELPSTDYVCGNCGHYKKDHKFYLATESDGSCDFCDCFRYEGR